MKIKLEKNYLIIFVLIFSILFTASYEFSEAKTTKKTAVKKASPKKTSTKKKTTVKKKASSKKKKTSTKKKRRRKSRVRKIRVKELKETSKIEELKCDTLSSGVFLKEYMIGDSKFQYNVNVIEADISNPLNSITILKAYNQISELEKLQKMTAEFDSLNNEDKTLCGAVNGNFWRAYSNYPIGPTIINGEVVEMLSYKKWSSAFFDSRSRMYIDSFAIDASLKSKNGMIFKIDAVNRRSDTNQIILYNTYGGDSIPYVPKRNIIKALSEAVLDLIYQDSTDSRFDSLEFKNSIAAQQRIGMTEYNIPKLELRYLTPPAINKRIACLVTSFGEGAMATNPKGCVISLGRNFDLNLIPKIGDTLFLEYSTNVLSNKIFMNGVCGTPRIVRNGKASNEAVQEGSTGKRFIQGQLPRTAIGVNRSNTKLYIAIVSPTLSSKQSVGATLRDLSMIMKIIGCHNAMNLDGGGSTIMSINNQNILYPSNPDSGRRISVGVGISVKKKNRFFRAVTK